MATTHGKCRTLEYITWLNMISRCEYPNRKDFKHYGGRGIRVCDKWRDSFESFLADMGPRPFQRASLDRINTDGNYEPGNCRWATQKSQTRNKKNNRLLTIGGITKTLADWADEYGISARTVWKRLNRGWDPYKSLTHRFSGRWVTIKGSRANNSTP